MIAHAATRLPLSKRCTVCRHTKSASEFHRYAYVTNQGKASERLDSRCKACQNTRRRRQRVATRAHEIAMCRQWRTAHPEAMRAAMASWRARNPEKIRAWRENNRPKVRRAKVISEQKRRRQGFVPSAARIRVAIETTLELARVGSLYLDAYDGSLIERPTIDHIVALADGGTHDVDNLCVTSRANNSSKHARPLLHWLVKREALRRAS